MPPHTSYNQSEKENIEQEIAAMLQKGAIQVVSPMKGEFISPIFLVPKKDGGEQTSDQPQEVEFPHSVSTLQNGGIAPPQTYNSGKGFHDQDRSQRCLLLCTHEPAASAFPEVHLGGGGGEAHGISSLASLLV